MLTDTEYTAARAIVDKAQTYWETHATYGKGGFSSMSAELASHPDYAACTNDMRGDVEEYELHRDKPERFTAYVVPDSEPGTYKLTLWPGQRIGKVTHRKSGKRRDTVTVWTDWHMCYRGYLSHDAQCINLTRVR